MKILFPMIYFMDEERMHKRFEVYTSNGELRLIDSYTKRAYKVSDAESSSDTVVLRSIS